MDYELAEFLLGDGIEQRHVDALKENEVCSMVFGLLADEDFVKMNFKVGLMRRLIALRDKWLRSIKHSGTDLVPHVPAWNNDFENPGTSTPDKIEPMKMQVDSITEDSPASNTDVLDRDVQTIPDDSLLGIAPAQKRFTLPKFSARVASALQHQKAGQGHFLNAVVEECAYHNRAHGDMTSKRAYTKFSRHLCEKYPCLQYGEVGCHHWGELECKEVKSLLFLKK